ncbi:DNA repair protein RecN [uncultured Paenalcaligenes sp.]|uniref:DNA repair protein RecN n=1 Tax=uncultured Paenalcaligenes sp. TaxID=1588925 RepID=UPI00260AACD9|nr:DNA repair protein RecN [uncultured Paenalcaligenes sp.]
MLRSLHLRDFVIVDQNHIEFDTGFTVFSGETGAGKSILIDALSLALGGRGDASVVRQQSERAEIIATFEPDALVLAWLKEHDIAIDDDELILRRVIDAQGRSRAYINGSPSTAAQLKELGAMLIDIHGQHAHQSLLNPQSHYAILDTQGQHIALSHQVTQAWQQWQKAQASYDNAQHSAQANAQELELLDWQIQQLSDLGLGAGDWENLTQEHQRLAHAQSLLDSAGRSLHLLENDESGAIAVLHAALSSLQSVLSHDPNLLNIYQTLESAQIACAESISDLNSYLTDVELDPERLAHIDHMMSVAFNLARKHKCEPEDLPARLEQLLERQQQLQQSVDSAALLAAVEKAHKSYNGLAEQLSQARLVISQNLSKQVTQAMQQLSMQGGQFVVQLNPAEPSAHGNEKVEFLVAGHAGVAPSALAKVASGGELARISLALSVIASQAARVPTLIFDEVDSGIGGAIAEVVGRLLHELGQRHQVLCVTHLPQVAACGDNHFLVSKASNGSQTVSKIQHLTVDQRIEEISRMLGGIEITATTREHAKEMLKVNH